MGCDTTNNVSDTTMRRWLPFLLGIGVAGGIAYIAYKVIIEPTIEEQRKMIQALWGKIQELELRVHELERDWSQNEEEHYILRNEIEKLRRRSLSPEMRRKLEELLAILDAITQHQHEVRRTPSLTIPLYV